MSIEKRERVANEFLAPWIIPELHLLVLQFVGCMDISMFMILYHGFAASAICCTETKDLYDEDDLDESYESGYLIKQLGSQVPDPRNGNHIKTRNFVLSQPIFTHLQMIVIEFSYITMLDDTNQQEYARSRGLEDDYKMKMSKAKRWSGSSNFPMEKWYNFTARYQIDVQQCQQQGDVLTLWQLMQRFWREHIPQHFCCEGQAYSHFYMADCKIIETNLDQVVVYIDFSIA
jgi:hypothetical protein